MGWLGKVGVGLSVLSMGLTSGPQYIWNFVTQGREAADRSLLGQLKDALEGPPASSPPPSDPGMTIIIDHPTVWDSVAPVVSDPLNIVLIGAIIIGGAFVLRWTVDWLLDLSRPRNYRRRRYA